MSLASFGFGSVRSLLLPSARKRRETTHAADSGSNEHDTGACTVATTDKNTTTAVAAAEAPEPDNPSSKRPRRLPSLSASSSSTTDVQHTGSTATACRQHLPSLEISTTFESTSSSSSPTSSSSPPPVSSSSFSSSVAQSTSRALTTITNNHSNVSANASKANFNKNLKRHQRTPSYNEYYTAAISCAKSRLHAAQRMSMQSEQHLLRVQKECDQSKLEVQTALELVDVVEKKWGVIHIDSDEEDVNDGSRDLSKSSSNAAGDDDDDVEEEEANNVQLIHVCNAGESIVHGRYHLHHPTASTANNDTRIATSIQHLSPMQYYIHEEGPFLIQSIWFDVCIFQRGGYGDKVRWCIGLIPCQCCSCDQYHRTCCDAILNDSIGSDYKENNEVGREAQHPQRMPPPPPQQQQHRHHDRSRNFAQAYIYYWMEVDARTEIDIACLFSKDASAGEDMQLSVPSWRVCHGMRPLPVLEDVSEVRDTRRWWQVWKH